MALYVEGAEVDDDFIHGQVTLALKNTARPREIIDTIKVPNDRLTQIQREYPDYTRYDLAAKFFPSYFDKRDIEGRPDKAEVYMGVAFQFSDLSTCNRGNIGAVIVKDGRIISTGYNGSPPGMAHCTDVGCDELVLYEDWPHEGMRAVEMGCQRTIHAEANALLWAARAGVATRGATMYCTDSPCVNCAKAIIAAGITFVVYAREYRIKDGCLLLSAAGVPVESLDSFRTRGGRG